MSHAGAQHGAHSLVRQIGSYEESLALVRDGVQISEEQRDWLLRRTAERVYFGGERLPDDFEQLSHSRANI